MDVAEISIMEGVLNTPCARVKTPVLSAESSPNLTWATMGLRVDSARPQRVSGSARTDSRRAESARNPIATYAKVGDDCANAQPGLKVAVH